MPPAPIARPGASTETAPAAGALERGGTVLLVLLVFGGLRAAQVLSITESPWDSEFHALGTLALDLEAGTAALWPPDFVGRYFYTQPSSLVTQAVNAALSWVFGVGSYTLRSTSILAELVCVGLLSAVLVRRTRGPIVLVAMLPWLLPHAFARGFLLAPYGNHTEFVWVAVALLGAALHAPLELPRLRSWWPVPALAVIGFGLYPPLLPAILAAGEVWMNRRRRAGLPIRGLLVSSLGAVAIGGVLGMWMLSAWLPDLPQARAQLQPDAVRGAWGDMLPTVFLENLPPLGLTQSWLHGAAVTLAAATALVPGRAHERSRAFAAFAVLWFVGAFALGLLSTPYAPRYLLNAYFATLLCASVAAAAPPSLWKLPGLALCGALAWTLADDNLDAVDPAVWEETRHADTLSSSARLGVLCGVPGDLPYQADLLRRRHGQPPILTLPRPQDPRQACGDVHSIQRENLDRVQSGLPGLDPSEREAALQAMGAEAWISHGRSLEALEESLGEWQLAAAFEAAILRGAALEAHQARVPRPARWLRPVRAWEAHRHPPQR